MATETVTHYPAQSDLAGMRKAPDLLYFGTRALAISIEEDEPETLIDHLTSLSYIHASITRAVQHAEERPGDPPEMLHFAGMGVELIGHLIHAVALEAQLAMRK